MADKTMQNQAISDDALDYIDGKITFTGALDKYWDVLSKNWCSKTQTTYLKHYLEILAPYFSNQPLADYDAAYFENAINLVRASGTISSREKESKKYYSESTLQHFRYILYLLLCVSSAGEGFENVLWGTHFGKATIPPPDETVGKMRTQIQKSFSPKQEYDIADELFLDPLEDGEKIGLLLMWVFGYRNKEACSLNWGNISPLREHPGLYILHLHTSNIKQSRETHTGGKTTNMFRIWPIPPLVYDFLMVRKAHIQNLIDCGEIILHNKKSIETMPIACKGHEWQMRCTSSELSATGQKLFRKIKISDDQYEFFCYKPDSSDHLGCMAWDKDPTAYSLRRNIATHLFILGLPLEQIQYLMGHQITNPRYPRNSFTNPDLQFQMFKRLKLRPIVNEVNFAPQPMDIKDDTHLTNVSHLQANIVTSTAKVRIRITPYQPHDPCNISLKAHTDNDSDPIAISYRQRPMHTDQSTPVYMIAEYHSSYFTEYKRRSKAVSNAPQPDSAPIADKTQSTT